MAASVLRLGAGNCFWSVLLAPGTGCETKAPFEHIVKQSAMVIAAFNGDVADIVTANFQQLTGSLEPRLNLPLPQGDAKFTTIKAPEMPLATTDHGGQLRQRQLGQFSIRHSRDQLKESLMRSQFMIDFDL